MSNSLQPDGLQQARPPCPSPTPRVYSMFIESVMPSKHLILCCPLLLLPSVFPGIRVFSNKSALHLRWPKYWSFSFSISPPNEYSELISFRMDWFHPLAVKELSTVFSSTIVCNHFQLLNSFLLVFNSIFLNNVTRHFIGFVKFMHYFLASFQSKWDLTSVNPTAPSVLHTHTHTHAIFLI